MKLPLLHLFFSSGLVLISEAAANPSLRSSSVQRRTTPLQLETTTTTQMTKPCLMFFDERQPAWYCQIFGEDAARAGIEEGTGRSASLPIEGLDTTMGFESGVTTLFSNEAIISHHALVIPHGVSATFVTEEVSPTVTPTFSSSTWEPTVVSMDDDDDNGNPTMTRTSEPIVVNDEDIEIRADPTVTPTWSPTAFLEDEVTDIDNKGPTTTRTSFPTWQRKERPTPSAGPTTVPSSNPSVSPSAGPTTVPSSNPSVSPSASPSSVPSPSSSGTPSSSPSSQPSSSFSANPSARPSLSPSVNPSSSSPSAAPSSSHLLEDNSECVLYLKSIAYEDGTDENTWSCEFPLDYAKEKFGGRDIMDISGISNEVIDAQHAVSGETILRTTGARVEQRPSSPLDDRVTGVDDIILVVTDLSSVVIESLPEVDVRHHRRRLATRNTGVLKTLVLRPTAPNGAVVPLSAAQIRNDIFEDTICLASHMASCSYNQVEIQPANVGDGGVVDVVLDINPIEDGTRNGNRGELASNAIAKADELLGGDDGLSSKFDLVITCLPTSGTWIAFAYTNRFDSYYNKDYCSGSDIVMHEVGHNFGLSHSGLEGDTYGDYTGIMAYGTVADDAPRRCFNAVKNYRLGWYDLQIDSYDPMESVGNPQSFVLNGISDYKIDGSSDGELISLRLEQFGDEDGVDFYLGYNRKAFPNEGQSEGVDQVILYSKDNGDNGANSVRIAMINEGQSYSIDNYKGIGSTVTINVDSISDDMKDATISISATPPPPTDQPSVSCGSNGRFKVEIGIDNFSKENNWKLFESNSDSLVEEGMTKEEYFKNQQYVEPSKSSSYCLDPGCYDFKMYDSYGDGLNAAQGGFYRGILDTEIIFEGAAFQQMDTRTFCVEDFTKSPTKRPTDSPTDAPTNSPTNAPTVAPTMAPAFPTIPPTAECFDDDTLRYKTVKQCNWVGIDAGRCELSWENKLLKEFCPVTCGLCEPAPTDAPTNTPTDSPTDAPTNPPSKAPTQAPTNAPTDSPTDVPTNPPSKAPTDAPTPAATSDNGDCMDDSDFRYKGKKKCSWVEKDPSKRCALDAKEGDGKFISEYCPVTCNACGPDIGDNGPSCASDEILFRLELLLDNYNETSWEMKKVSDGSIVGEGAETEYKKNTAYNESLCLTKGDYSFTIFDVYGDGLTQGAGHYYGFLDNIEIFSGKDFQKEETTTFTVDVTPAPTVAPTIAPTAAPAFPTIPPTASCSPFRLNLLLDNYNETSWEMKKVSDGSVIVGEGAETEYKKNTAYNESLCLTPGDYSFTIFDVYGDGLTAGAGHYYGFLDNIEIFSGKAFEKEETTTFTVVDDDSSCVDNPNFKFKGDSSKNCQWLGEHDNGEKKCKKEKQTQDDGTELKLKYECPSTCGVKFGVGKCN